MDFQSLCIILVSIWPTSYRHWQLVKVNDTNANHYIDTDLEFAFTTHRCHRYQYSCYVYSIFNVKYEYLFPPGNRLSSNRTPPVLLDGGLLLFNTTYFQFQGRFFEQQQGTAMGSPISPIMANIHIEYFKIKAINTDEHLPRVWKRLWMTPFWSLSHQRKKRSWNISERWTHTSILQQKIQEQVGPSPLWIP